jgi:hypothetical protein
MDMHSRNQYLKKVRVEYLKTKSKNAKGKLLGELEKRTGMNRKYLIRKLRPHKTRGQACKMTLITCLYSTPTVESILSASKYDDKQSGFPITVLGNDTRYRIAAIRTGSHRL